MTDSSDGSGTDTTPGAPGENRAPPDRADWGRRGSDAGCEPDEERGQIILITGLTLAVLFVADVLL